MALERRRCPRFPANAAVRSHLSVTEGGDIWPERIRNISAGGISLLVDRPIAPGTMMTLDLYHIMRRLYCRRRLRVVSSIESEGGFIIGGPFDGELWLDELQGLT
jgi:hypothetical protein